MVISICQQLLRAERAENPIKRRQQHHQGRAKEGQEKSPALEGLLQAGCYSPHVRRLLSLVFLLWNPVIYPTFSLMLYMQLL